MILLLRSLWIPLLLWILHHLHLRLLLCAPCWRRVSQFMQHMDSFYWICSLRLRPYELSLLPLEVPLHQLHPPISRDCSLAIRYKKGEYIVIEGDIFCCRLYTFLLGYGIYVFVFLFIFLCSCFTNYYILIMIYIMRLFMVYLF